MRPKILFNPDSRSPNFFLPGLTAILLLNVTTFLTAFSIVREKERGTLEQLFVTPVRPMGLLLGKLLPYLMIGFFELCMILTFMRFVSACPFTAALFFCAAFRRTSCLSPLGILISTANSQAEAIQPLPHHPSQYLFLRLHLPETMPKFFLSSVISFPPPISSTSPAASSPRRRWSISGRRRRPSSWHHAPGNRRPPLPEQSHGVIFCRAKGPLFSAAFRAAPFDRLLSTLGILLSCPICQNATRPLRPAKAETICPVRASSAKSPSTAPDCAYLAAAHRTKNNTCQIPPTRRCSTPCPDLVRIHPYFFRHRSPSPNSARPNPPPPTPDVSPPYTKPSPTKRLPLESSTNNPRSHVQRGLYTAYHLYQRNQTIPRGKPPVPSQRL
jgi:hypothetical protein